MTTPARPTDCKTAIDRALGSEPVRIGLIAAAIVLAASAIGGVAYLREPATDGPQARIARDAHSRLPRPRPDEPATTGSIDPMPPAAHASARGEPALPPAPTGETRRVDELRTSAMLIAGSRTGCTGGVRSEVLENSAARGELVIRVECGNGVRFYLDEAELELNRLSAIEPIATRLADRDAIEACEAKLKFGLPVPSSFNRLLPSTGVYRAPGDDAVVTFDFEARNGLGFPLAMQAHCLFEERDIARLEVHPR